VIVCGYDMAWAGKCTKNNCEDHKLIKCSYCGKKAVKDCGYCGFLVCGKPLCKDCNCKH